MRLVMLQCFVVSSSEKVEVLTLLKVSQCWLL